MHLKKDFVTCVCFLLVIPACAQNRQLVSSSNKAEVYKKRVQLLNYALNRHFKESATGLYIETTDSAKNENPHSWLWPLCAYIQAANEMEVLEPAKQYMLPVEQAIDQYYSNTPPLPAYQDYVKREKTTTKYYDDNQWVAIAYLDAYKRNHKKKYLEVSEMIYRFMMNGLDSAAGGGIYWREKDMTTKNTCSNGPGALVALQLYQVTGKKEYLQTALSVYNWTRKYLQSPEGLYWDNIKIPSMQVDKAKFTYNTGTMLQSAVLLYNITKNKDYLKEAQRVAGAGKEHFFKNGRLPHEYWFNAVMLRGYIELYKVDKNKAWLDFFREDAEQVWEKERTADNLVGTKKAKRLIDQAAMIEVYARLAEAEVIK
ncbi:glycoside hydrolase [Pedobacter sp. BS3]|uniref:glycoside hydrolase family 76 protein n=1 Tax=Pedobacter sp. BS3 TaxID=2567937 RepID=UPI0011EF0E89|nr:glycoside hydrolase family 76 protein [Pedobacter sp. BS3]TZF82628.1 glycoside hydrolase [Pedobacter sp. BS3]